MRTRLALVLLVGGCWPDPPPEPPPLAPLVSPLAEAAVAPWVQQVWFRAAPGERVEHLGLTDGPDPRPVVTLVAPDGTRRALRLDDESRAVPVAVVARPPAVESRSASSPDGALRVQIDVGERVTVTVTDARTGSRTVVVRDIAGRELSNPAVDVASGAVWLDVGGNLGGVVRVALSDGLPVRVVPEVLAGRPLPWRGEKGERVVYVEAGEVPLVIVAAPAGDGPLRSATDMKAEGRIPAALLPAALTADSRPVRFAGCTPDVPLTLVDAQGGLHVGEVPIREGRFCGRGCTELFGRSPEGAPRHVGTVSGDPLTGVWTTWFDPALPVSGRTWIEESRAADVPTVPACFPPRDPERWLVEPRTAANNGETFTHLVFGNQILRAASTRGPLNTITTVIAQGPAQHKPVPAPNPPPEPVAVTRDGGAKALVQDGNLVWTEVATGATSVLLEGRDQRRLADPAFGVDESVAYVTDDGAEPGLLRIVLAQGKMDRIVAGAGIRRPLAAVWDGERRVAYVEERGGRSWVVTARPLTDAEAAAFDVGPATLVDVQPRWVPVDDRGGALVRCEGPGAVTVGVDPEGGFLAWGGTRIPVRAAAFDGQSLRLFGEEDGNPLLLAELRLQGRVGVWWGYGVQAPFGRQGWLPEADAAALPDGGRCAGRP